MTNFLLLFVLSSIAVTTPLTSSAATSFALDWIGSLSPNSLDIAITNRQIYINSIHSIPTQSLQLLTYGLTFIPTPDSYLAPIEQGLTAFNNAIIRQFQYPNADGIPGKQFFYRKVNRVRATNDAHVTNYIQLVSTSLIDKFKAFAESSRRFSSNLRRGVYKAFLQLASDRRFYISDTDKHLGVGVFDYDVISSLVWAQLRSSSYRILQGKNNARAIYHSFVTQFTTIEGWFTERKFEYFSSAFDNVDKWSFPKAYAIPKIHKAAGLAVRIIVPAMKLLTFLLSKWVAYKLNKVASKCKLICKGALDLVRTIELTPLVFPQDCVFLTADVEAMYPSIDPVRGVDVVIAVLRRCTDITAMKLERLKICMRLILEHNVFEFEGVYLHQVVGTAMGTPFAPPYANLFMFGLEWDILQTLGSAVYFYTRYIDDMLAALVASAVTAFKAAFDTACPGIAFTYVVNSQAVDYLDLHISKGTRFLQTGIVDLACFQKPANAYSYIPWFSFHPPSMKRSFIVGELTRYIRNSSSQDAFIRVRDLFFDRLRARGYPRTFLLETFSPIRFKMRTSLLAGTPAEHSERRPFFNLPYSPISSRFNARASLNAGWDALKSRHPKKFNLPPFIVFSKGRNVYDIVRGLRPKRYRRSNVPLTGQ